MWSRIHLIPLLMAEGDRREYRGQQLVHAVQSEIMKDVAGWEVCICAPVSSFARILNG